MNGFLSSLLRHVLILCPYFPTPHPPPFEHFLLVDASIGLDLMYLASGDDLEVANNVKGRIS